MKFVLLFQFQAINEVYMLCKFQAINEVYDVISMTVFMEYYARLEKEYRITLTLPPCPHETVLFLSNHPPPPPP